MIYKTLKEHLRVRGQKWREVGEMFEANPAAVRTKELLKRGFIEPVNGLETKDAEKVEDKICFDDWETNGGTSELAKVLIAPEDYVEDDKKYFTYDEACAIEKKLNNGWRLPTRQEWVLICEEFGTKGGVYDVDTLMKNLGLEKNGLLYSGDDEPSYAGNYGNYWSSTPVPSNSSYAYTLYFYGTNYINPSSSWYRYLGFSVRLVKELQND